MVCISDHAEQRWTYYTDVSGNLGSLYSGKGMGTVVSQAQLASSNWEALSWDIGYNSGHTWIVLGQCSIK